MAPHGGLDDRQVAMAAETLLPCEHVLCIQRFLVLVASFAAQALHRTRLARCCQFNPCSREVHCEEPMRCMHLARRLRSISCLCSRVICYACSCSVHIATRSGASCASCIAALLLPLPSSCCAPCLAGAIGSGSRSLCNPFQLSPNPTHYRTQAADALVLQCSM